jgi:hypothetical protein
VGQRDGLARDCCPTPRAAAPRATLAHRGAHDLDEAVVAGCGQRALEADGDDLCAAGGDGIG